jgi:hypothetical protein
MATQPTQQEVQNAVTAATTAALTDQILGKKWYESKTLWVNIVAAVAMIAQMRYGFVFDSSIQTLALTLINVGLRHVTSDPIVW